MYPWNWIDSENSAEDREAGCCEHCNKLTIIHIRALKVYISLRNTTNKSTCTMYVLSRIVNYQHV